VSLVVALDIGGTFTDLVAFDLENGRIIQSKSSTTPYDLSVGIRKALEKSGLPIAGIETFVHGSTVAINTAIERTGAPTALIVTEGTRDVYQIGRGNRPESYNFLFRRPEPYVARRHTHELVERLNAAGEVITPFDEASAVSAARRAQAGGAQSVAVCCLHAWANPEHESRMGRILETEMPHAFLSLSHEILREYREYERTSTTVLNAYVGPRVSRYLQDLERLLAEMGFEGQLLIMQSNGGTMSPKTAMRLPIATMESGPVGGIIAGAQVMRDIGITDVIAFDMGGTTAKVSLVKKSEPTIAQGYYVGGEASGHPVMYPVVDIVEVGAGGGSIAWIDEVGGLKVGPRSAGGHPGPVCYRQGGTEPTVTDANLVLGRLGADRFLGGEMPLDIEAAREAIRSQIAVPLGLDVEAAAHGIIRIAIAEMSLAVQSVSIGRGHDPRDFAMVAFGGAGPLHAAEIARELHIPRLVIPRVPGHFSALGMLLSDLRHDYVRTYYKPLDECSFEDLARIFSEMEAEGRDLLRAEGAADDETSMRLYLDMRYAGQEFPIQTPVEQQDLRGGDRDALRRIFDRVHDQRFGHQAPDERVEIVNCRLTARGRRPTLAFPSVMPRGGTSLVAQREIVLQDPHRRQLCPVHDRDLLQPGQEIAGPAAILEYASTTVIFDGDRLTVLPTGELVVTINHGDEHV
jgi:N-methylhydantoinase A